MKINIKNQELFIKKNNSKTTIKSDITILSLGIHNSIKTKINDRLDQYFIKIEKKLNPNKFNLTYELNNNQNNFFYLGKIL